MLLCCLVLEITRDVSLQLIYCSFLNYFLASALNKNSFKFIMLHYQESFTNTHQLVNIIGHYACFETQD